MHDFKPYRSILSEIPLLTCCEWRDCSCSPSPRSNGLNLHHYVTSIGIWVEIASKSEKIKENCTFFFEQPIKWHPHLAKKHFNTKHNLRKEWGKQSAKEKVKTEEQEGKEREKKEGEISVRFSRTRVCARAFQPQCCFFAVTSVTRREEVRSKFDRKARKLGEIEEKTTRKNVLFSMVQSPFGTITSSVC